MVYKMKNLFQKFKTWRTGQTLYSVGKLVGIAAQKPKPIQRPKEFDPTPLARILNSLCQFWVKHFKWLITTSLIAIGLYLAYLQLIKPK